jgi:hypothetical protein
MREVPMDSEGALRAIVDERVAAVAAKDPKPMTARGYEVSDLNVTVDGDMGFCSFLYHVTGTLKAGGDVDMWVRATLGRRRIGGQWLIVHDHESVPFDAATGQALTALQP